MPTRKIHFKGHKGAKLEGRIELPVVPVRAWAIFAHCFTCGKDLVGPVRFARALAETGIAVLRFDFTGLGASEGEFAETNFSTNTEDLMLAAGFLRTEFAAPSLLIGHSLGGAAVLAAASQIDGVHAVAVIAAPSEPAHLVKVLGDTSDQARTQGEAKLVLAGRTFRISRQLIENLESAQLQEKIAQLRKPLLVIHSPADEIVDFSEGQKLFQLAAAPKAFIALDGADHLLSRREDAEYAARCLSVWAERYLLPSQSSALQGGELTVAELGTGRFANGIHVGRHVLVADEPESAGGDDAGPGPYDYLLAGLGACTSMTLRMYAQHKHWPLDQVSVTLSHKRVHAKDCADCETESGQIMEIEREITIEGALDEAQRARLLEIADKCPVHRSLMGEIKIRTRLK